MWVAGAFLKFVLPFDRVLNAMITTKHYKLKSNDNEDYALAAFVLKIFKGFGDEGTIFVIEIIYNFDGCCSSFSCLCVPFPAQRLP